MSDADSFVSITLRLAKLLHRLGSDNDFRDQFRRDPRGVLSREGIEVPPGAIPEKVVLPSKRDLQKNFGSHLDEFAEQVKNHSFTNIFSFHGKAPRH